MNATATKKTLDPNKEQNDVWTYVFSIKPENHEPDPVHLIRMIREGIPGDSISKFADFLNMPKIDIYTVLHLKARTAQRAASTKLDVDKSDHLVQIAKVYRRCVEVLEDRERAIIWLKSPNYALGNQAPWDLLDTTEGIELVQDTLGRIEYGVFV